MGRSATGMQQQADDQGRDHHQRRSGGLRAADNLALIGTYDTTVGHNADQGTAVIFVRSGSSWRLQQEILAPDAATSLGPLSH